MVISTSHIHHHQPWKPRNSCRSQPRFFFSLRGGASEPVRMAGAQRQGWGVIWTVVSSWQLYSPTDLQIHLSAVKHRKSDCFRTSFGHWDQKCLDQNSRFIRTTQNFTSSQCSWLFYSPVAIIIAKNRATQIVWDVYNEILVGNNHVQPVKFSPLLWPE